MVVVYRRWLADPEGYWREFIEKTRHLIYWAKPPELLRRLTMRVDASPASLRRTFHQ
jgi:hypothetical protein